MKVTVLGSGDATGVPVVLCDCDYCIQSNRRRRPALLIETSSVTLVFDCGPDIQEQLHEVGVIDPDAFFLTHAHPDHSDGIIHLIQSAKWDAEHLATVEGLKPTSPDSFKTDYTFYLTQTAMQHLTESVNFDRFNDQRIGAGESVDIGDSTITAFPVDHHRPVVDTLGFTVTSGDVTVGYAPDMRTFTDGAPTTHIDLLVCEGAALLGQPVHGPKEELRASIESTDPDRVVLVNVNEHLQRAHTEALRTRAENLGYELGSDFQTIDL